MNHIINSSYLLNHARKFGYAVPAFNIHNLETIQVVMNIAKELESPVILAGTPGTYSYAGVQQIIAIVESMAAENNQQVVLHLDHHHDFEDIHHKIRSGIRSAMIDGSAMPLKDNIAITRKVTELCHYYGCSVEAEIGQLVGQEDDLIVEDVDDPYTHPEDARLLVEQTNIDSLAVAIGSAHGVYKATPKLDFERLQKIARLVDIPLVLHGASGIADSDVQKCIQMGISKVNVATDLKLAFAETLKSFFLEKPGSTDPREYNQLAKAAMADVVRHKIITCGSAGRIYSVE
ncbi:MULTISPECIES: tagatose-bisphosphate aldolase subunit GatY [Atlantibacter]|uniref:tagatose-bisphosphate aldolase subunit GatY n=1 Tax=Atlantibacter TaxID=1903434 RepID=UPI0005C194AD|nr:MULTISPECIES: tagatose-bisphosphate aldolase subunit GatY [Atlantibacter]MCQ4969275.1 tagatose-bisphosphate aldolase subunit GatY [Enterobacteriaceae bacterium DFI.7.85]HAI48553.1 ketose-bisphosphate aldolase [Enterobacteriaceae bacterium]KIU33973.1 tagatose-bisphosphate aldolase [Atlantibacter hermannii]MDU7389722.1 tagatose-bisphosphate aldolase subunit GatY [Atlantibacter hermannii]MDW4576802.1 tagatose-bisphosphate aldolase subunit GatY [Atlantibacter hermannii]